MVDSRGKEALLGGARWGQRLRVPRESGQGRCRFQPAAIFLTLGVGVTLLACSGELTETVEPTVCEAEKRWIGEDEGNPEMMPGEPCLQCHRGNTDGPRFGAAGTVYKSGDQGERCYGEPGVTVIIEGSDGKAHTMVTNGSGNFYTHDNVPAPYTAKIVVGTQEFRMATPQTNGDCNSCHRKGGEIGVRIFTGQ